MKQTSSWIGVVLGPFVAAALFAGCGKAPTPVGSSAPEPAASTPPKSNREVRKYAGKAEALFEKLQKVHATITSIKLNSTTDLVNELNGEVATFPACPDSRYSTVDSKLRGAADELASAAAAMATLAETKVTIDEATRVGVDARIIEDAKSRQAATVNQIKMLIQEAGKKLQELKDDSVLDELFDKIDK